ncbi:hypothetical protein SCUCBS95973_000699 [Sporothrix curviconia]|uniref:FAD/NAD(P)-binding domain-containing protein n=1 Tax=Sporothrix curviconia TaxID=1260050 RepID=A0ABP0ASK2_9PEZI
MGDTLRFFAFIVAFLPGYAGAALARKVRAILHGWTYKGPTDTPKVVVVVGGSFAGYQLMARLTETLPTGWQAVLVEKNEHFNWSFAFPRFSVVPGHERTAFMAYAKILAKGVQRGIARFVQGEAASVVTATAAAGGKDNDKHVRLASGETVPYDILVVATGSAQRPPAKLLGAAHKATACAELRTLQDRIRRARTVAVVGGGAVGVELVTDIKTYAHVVAERHRADNKDHNKDDSVADKDVTLVHSRTQLLNRFGPRLHEHVAGVLAKQGITVELGQRVTIAYKDGGDESAGAGRPGTLHFPDGRAVEYDCILLCTGQTPNSALFKEALAGALAETGEIRVNAGLQVVVDEKSGGGGGQGLSDVYAFGDVAATGGPKMARAGFFQADVIVDNILASIAGRPAKHRYVPSVVEPSLKLTLGKDATVVYMDMNEAQTKSILMPKKGDAEDMYVKQSWQFMGVKYTDDDDDDNEQGEV